ncbi:MAG: alpha/beta fold hydrolase [Pseudomonas sp.]
MTAHPAIEILHGTHPLTYQLAGEGKPVLCIGGLGMNASSWWPVYAPKLLALDRQVISYSHRTYAMDNPDNMVCQVTDLAADCIELIEHLRLKSVDLLGTSLGSLVAQEVALARPELVDSLCMLGTWGRQNLWLRRMITAELEFFRRGAMSPGDWIPKEYHRAILLLKYFPVEDLCDDQLVSRRLQGLEKNVGYHSADWLALMTAIHGYDGRLKALPMIQARTLVLAFERDILMPAALVREAAEAIPGARCETITGAGHLGVFSHSEAIFKHVLPFLGQHAQVTQPLFASGLEK